MPDDMYECEVKKLFMRSGAKIWQWAVVPVSSLGSTPQGGGIRCKHCYGRVRVHKQQVAHGPADHVEHLRRRDSENCKAGHHFNGMHRISDEPVE
jgi:hypothetical protein